MDIDSDYYVSKWRPPAGGNCWTLIRQVYRDVMKIDLGPAQIQYSRGWTEIDFAETAQGDLVLFKESTIRRHAGLHISDSKFLHLWTDGTGVCLARYTDPVWCHRFWKAYTWQPPQH